MKKRVLIEKYLSMNVLIDQFYEKLEEERMITRKQEMRKQQRKHENILA